MTSVLIRTLWARSMQVSASSWRIMCFIPGTKRGAADTAWRELTTILVVDEVIPGIRRALRARFSRAKNTAQSRGAVRSLAVMELEKRVSREIIDSYEDVTVTALDSDPTVCVVEFAFTVAHGLNQIWLSAHITV